MIDTNRVILNYLQSGIGEIIDNRIHCPRLPEKAVLPAISFFTRGGEALPIKGGDVSPSVQFDCWGKDPEEARTLYGVLFEHLQGTGGYYTCFVPVNVDDEVAYILEIREEVHGQDIRDPDMLYLVRGFFMFRIRAGGIL